MGEDEKKEVEQFLRSLFRDDGSGESLEELEKWVATQRFTEPVDPEPEDFKAASRGLPPPQTETEQAHRYRLAQASYLLRRWREARRR